MFDKKITYLYIFTAMTYLASLPFATYPYQFAVKALPIFLLCITCFSQLTGKHKVFMSLALLFSLVGDIFLALSVPMSFQYGLGAFLIAHLCYGLYFLTLSNRGSNKQLQYSALVAIAVFGGLAAYIILPHTSVLIMPVASYLVIICLMAMIAFYKGLNKQVMLGVSLFLLSDTLLAINLFVSPFSAASVAVMVTYYLAQYFITRGIFTQTLNKLT